MGKKKADLRQEGDMREWPACSGRLHCSSTAGKTTILSYAQFLLRFVSSGAVPGITEQTRYNFSGCNKKQGWVSW